MPLEAGGAAHEVFAAHRLYEFREYGQDFYNVPHGAIETVTIAAGNRIFGEARLREMFDNVDAREDYRTRLQQFSLTALYNCGFYDDPGDKRRTTTNIEEMCIAYMDKFTWRDQLPYWDGKDFLGIEIPVDVVIILMCDDGAGNVRQFVIRFIGKADGIHYSAQLGSPLRVHENKTASRLGEAWETSWETNHQPTGYMVALSAILQQSVSQALLLGCCLPLPKAYTINGLARVVVRRDLWQLSEWLQWLLHTVQLHEQYKDRPLEAPQYTHSCNRYFRPCQFIPLCATEPEERAIMFEQMNVDEWSPLHSQEGKADD